MKIPFLDLQSLNGTYRDDIISGMGRVLSNGHYICGTELEFFEKEFAEYCGVRFCIGVGNGLDALRLLLTAYGIGPGDEVIVPANTFIATWLAVTQCGATPIPVEVDARTQNIDPLRIPDAVSSRTAAIIPVHLYGQPADMDAINAVASKHALLVIEDAAQSQGATYGGRKAGSLGHSAATSFYPGKNLGALGDGGAVLTDDVVIAEKVRKLRNYGSQVKYHHELLGFNSRLDDLQAAVLRSKLIRLDLDNERRRRIASLYSVGLDGLNLTCPKTIEKACSVWHLFVIRSPQRDLLRSHLAACGIETLIHYPIPPHKQPCYADLTFSGLEFTEQVASEVLSLPISPIMEDIQVQYVIEQTKTLCLKKC